MNKILVICGPTATGKTALALFLAEKFRGDILSADSRQVYKRMDIITGKDLPVSSKLQISPASPSEAGRANVKWSRKRIRYWETQKTVRIWLVDLVEPWQDFSVSQWVGAAKKVIYNLWKEKKLPVIVGGTGFYIKALLDGIETIDIPPDEKLRDRLKNKKTEELLEILQKSDYQRAISLNESDRKNPRRLVRAIEIALRRGSRQIPAHKELEADALLIGLIAPRGTLRKRIDRRVEERLKQGALGEAKKLFAKGVSWNSEAMTGTGYRQLRRYFGGKETLSGAVALWKTAEYRDAKKQLTWFKKDRRIKWFDITGSKWREKVEKTAGDWYHRNRET